jgi:hypothetical protein
MSGRGLIATTRSNEREELMDESAARDVAQPRTRVFPSEDGAWSRLGARSRGAAEVSFERRCLGWAVTLTGVAVMATGAVLIALSSV